MIPSTRTTLSLAILAMIVGALVVSLQLGATSEGGRARRHPVPPPFAIFRTLDPADAHGRVALLRLEPPEGQREVTALACVRVHYAGGRGLCVVEEPRNLEQRYVAYIFDRGFTPGRRLELQGVPTRVRVAPNGRRAVVTTYAEEESAEGERLASGAVVFDLATGRVLADLRQFHIDREQFPSIGHIDIGSVSFEADSDRFFAALSSDDEQYLAAGSVNRKQMSVIRAGVASESLSPDGRQLAVKKVHPMGWQLAVIDLATWQERELPQGRPSVDDQVEWLDNQHVLFHDADEETTSLWMLPVDGVNGPRVFVKHAYSGTVQR